MKTKFTVNDTPQTADKRQPRFCKDCRHFKCQNCFHPSAIGIDIVSGDTLSRNPYIMRDTEGACGEEGKLWEPKEKTPF